MDRLNRFSPPKFALWGLLIAGFVFASCVGGMRQPTLNPGSAPQKSLVTVDGATLDKIPLDWDNAIYLQTIDLHKMQIDQLVGDVEGEGSEGLYYPSQNDEASPFFKRLTVTAVRDRYQTQHPSGIFSMMNVSFFEDYKSSTRLSFPIKANGVLITTGSSPYGPIQDPADPYYRTIQLKALTWDNEKAIISSYDPVTGYPLNTPGVQNGIVSYAYQDHPAYVLAGDPVNRYHVIGVLNKDAAENGNRLLIATVNRTTLQYAAEVLRQRGVTSDIMTIDGGISTYLWSAKLGDLVLPQAAEGEKAPALPHYFGIRSRASRSGETQTPVLKLADELLHRTG